MLFELYHQPIIIAIQFPTRILIGTTTTTTNDLNQEQDLNQVGANERQDSKVSIII